MATFFKSIEEKAELSGWRIEGEWSEVECFRSLTLRGGSSKIANRIVMVVCRWLWVVGLRRCVGESAFKELQMHCNAGVKVGLDGR